MIFKDLNNDGGRKTDAVDAGLLETLEVFPVSWLLFPTSCGEKLKLVPSMVRLARGIWLAGLLHDYHLCTSLQANLLSNKCCLIFYRNERCEVFLFNKA